MKTAREFVDVTNDMDDAQMVAAVEARDAEIRAEVLVLECSAHKKELRGTRAATLREAAALIDGHGCWGSATALRELADRAERGES